MRKLLIGISLLLFTTMVVTADDDARDFSEVADRLAAAGCIEVNFLSIIESDIFNSIDTTVGLAVLSNDGRYDIDMGDDWYIFTGSELYSYSQPNNQVVIEQVEPEAVISDQISFLTRLNAWYDYTPTKKRGEYSLTRKFGVVGDVPDSLVAQLDPKSAEIESMYFYDINDDLNRIIFQSQALTDECSDSAFIPDFPDSVDVLRL